MSDEEFFSTRGVWTGESLSDSRLCVCMSTCFRRTAKVTGSRTVGHEAVLLPDDGAGWVIITEVYEVHPKDCHSSSRKYTLTEIEIYYPSCQKSSDD